MIETIKEYNNGLFIVQEIYDTAGNKILDKRSGELFNNYEDDPITVPKERRGDYFETTEPVDEREVEPIEEDDENALEERNEQEGIVAEHSDGD